MNKIKKRYNELWNQKCSNYPRLPNVLPAVRRIIAIGDIHGDLAVAKLLLKAGRVIDDNDNWIGGDTVVVQLGDQIDSCRHKPCETHDDPNDKGEDIEILMYFTKLHKKAMNHGGAVYSIIGNHEMMNVYGRYDNVSKNNFQVLNNYRTREGNIIRDGKEARGYIFSPGNEMSEFLACTRPMTLVIGNNLFVHGGVVPEIAKKYSVNQLNMILFLLLNNAIENKEKYSGIFSTEISNGQGDPDSYNTSVLWTRKYSRIEDTKEQCEKLFGKVKEVYKINGMVVGHTPQLQKGINSICDDSIWFTDVGSSHAFNEFTGNGKKLQVLEILNDNNFNIISVGSH